MINLLQKTLDTQNKSMPVQSGSDINSLIRSVQRKSKLNHVDAGILKNKAKSMNKQQ